MLIVCMRTTDTDRLHCIEKKKRERSSKRKLKMYTKRIFLIIEFIEKHFFYVSNKSFIIVYTLYFFFFIKKILKIF